PSGLRARFTCLWRSRLPPAIFSPSFSALTGSRLVVSGRISWTHYIRLAPYGDWAFLKGEVMESNQPALSVLRTSSDETCCEPGCCTGPAEAKEMKEVVKARYAEVAEGTASCGSL